MGPSGPMARRPPAALSPVRLESGSRRSACRSSGGLFQPSETSKTALEEWQQSGFRVQAGCLQLVIFVASPHRTFVGALLLSTSAQEWVGQRNTAPCAKISRALSILQKQAWSSHCEMRFNSLV